MSSGCTIREAVPDTGSFCRSVTSALLGTQNTSKLCAVPSGTLTVGTLGGALTGGGGAGGGGPRDDGTRPGGLGGEGGGPPRGAGPPPGGPPPRAGAGGDLER